MKRLAAAVIVAALLVLVPTALASGALTGTYKTTITNNPEFKGTWTFKFSGNGTFKLSDEGETVVTGSYSVKGSTITFPTGEKGRGACPGVGKYTLTNTGGKLTFKKISDSCGGRKIVLGHPYTKVG